MTVCYCFFSLFLYSFYRWDREAHVFWLCVVDELFLVYRVVFELPSVCKDWSSKCALFYGSVRRATYSKSRYACHYYICDATREKVRFNFGIDLSVLW